MRDVAIISTAQTAGVSREPRLEGELVQDVVTRALAAAGAKMTDIGFTCSGSSDYLEGRPFAFVAALDGLEAWPPISESHVEMDGAWALYEAWVKIQTGQADTALVFAFGKPTTGDIDKVLCAQLDPYTMAPLWPDALSIAALQARALLDASTYSERDFAEIAATAAWDAAGVELAVEKLVKAPYTVAPLRAHDAGPALDGAAAIVLAAADHPLAQKGRPAWIRGIDHRVEPHQLGLRDLAVSESTQQAGKRAGVNAERTDVAELYAPTTAQLLILMDALGLDPDHTQINPSGGAIARHMHMVSGLLRFIEAADRIHDGRADCAVAHATSGPALQQNMVAVLEAR